MRNVREVLRLSLGEGLSVRKIAQSLGMSRPTVNRYILRAAAAELSWPLPAAMDDTMLAAALFKRPESSPQLRRPEPEWSDIHRELGRKGVTLMLLWTEWKELHPDGHQYSQFAVHYHRWASRIDLVMRHDHRAGEKLFVDFAGDTIKITNPVTGEITEAQLFVAVSGASNYTYAEACVSQEMPHWIAAHVHAFEYMESVPAALVCDNLLAGVRKAHRYEPEINASYLEMARHYGCTILPARARKPRDKAKVESGVLVAERWILASLRNHTFFSLAEANTAIRVRLEWLNARAFKKLPGSRRSLFEELDRPAMRPLPGGPTSTGNGSS